MRKAAQNRNVVINHGKKYTHKKTPTKTACAPYVHHIRGRLVEKYHKKHLSVAMPHGHGALDLEGD